MERIDRVRYTAVHHSTQLQVSISIPTLTSVSCFSRQSAGGGSSTSSTAGSCCNRKRENNGDENNQKRSEVGGARIMKGGKNKIKRLKKNISTEGVVMQNPEILPEQSQTTEFIIVSYLLPRLTDT